MLRLSVDVPSHPRFPDVVNSHRHAGSMSAGARERERGESVIEPIELGHLEEDEQGERGDARMALTVPP